AELSPPGCLLPAQTFRRLRCAAPVLSCAVRTFPQSSITKSSSRLNSLWKLLDEIRVWQCAWVGAFALRVFLHCPEPLEQAGPVDVANDIKAEFAELLRRHQSQLFAYIYSLVHNFDDADDLYQQTSVVLWDKFEQFDRSKRFVPWACGVARYEVLNYLRARSR